ncbi:MAG: MCP four helix bundle domain-containing protein, partial [Bdellovibrio sp.]
MAQSMKIFGGIRDKILFVVTFPLASLFVATGFAFYIQSNMNTWLTTAYDSSLPRVEVLSKMALFRAQMTSNTWGAIANSDNKELRKTMVQRGRENLKWFEESQAQYEALLTLEAERTHYQPVMEQKKDFFETYNKIYSLLDYDDGEHIQEAKALLGGPGQKLNTTVRKVVDESLNAHLEQVRKDRTLQAGEQKVNKTLMILVTALSVISVLIMAIFQGARVAKGLNKVV